MAAAPRAPPRHRARRGAKARGGLRPTRGRSSRTRAPCPGGGTRGGSAGRASSAQENRRFAGLRPGNPKHLGASPRKTDALGGFAQQHRRIWELRPFPGAAPRNAWGFLGPAPRRGTGRPARAARAAQASLLPRRGAPLRSGRPVREAGGSEPGHGPGSTKWTGRPGQGRGLRPVRTDAIEGFAQCTGRSLNRVGFTGRSPKSRRTGKETAARCDPRIAVGTSTVRAKGGGGERTSGRKRKRKEKRKDAQSQAVVH